MHPSLEEPMAKPDYRANQKLRLKQQQLDPKDRGGPDEAHVPFETEAVGLVQMQQSFDRIRIGQQEDSQMSPRPSSAACISKCDWTTCMFDCFFPIS
jgi:hypothetical protein